MRKQPDNDERRPGERAASKVTHTTGDNTSVPGAALAWRIAALRIEADRVRSTWLACQLRDFADLLEVAEERGWFE